MTTDKYMALAFLAAAAGGVLFAAHDSRNAPHAFQAWAPPAIATPVIAGTGPALASPLRTKPPFHAPLWLGLRARKDGRAAARHFGVPKRTLAGSFRVQSAMCSGTKRADVKTGRPCICHGSHT